LISLDSTMRSNVTVGPPIDLLLYETGDLSFNRFRRFTTEDPDLRMIQVQWEHALRKAAHELPDVKFGAGI
jgi:putative proteasome-type protease